MIIHSYQIKIIKYSLVNQWLIRFDQKKNSIDIIAVDFG